MSYQLRDYQVEAVRCTLEEFKTVQATGLIHGTGLGKTITASAVISAYKPKRTLFLAPSAPLVWQAQNKIAKYTGLKCEVEMNIERASRDVFNMAPVIIGTVQTQCAQNNARVFDPKDIDLLILDELHHFTAPALRGVVAHYKQNPKIKILGLTATPKRTDEQALGQIVDSIAHVYELIDGKNDGYLVDVKQLFVPVDGLDLSHIKATAEDFNENELQAVLEDERIVQGMIEPICEIVWRVPKDSLKGKPVSEWSSYLRDNGKPRRSIVFCASVKQAEMFSEILNRAVRDSSAWVCESTSKKDRARIYDAFSKYEDLHTVCNVGILGEGYDNPLVENIIQARPTKSLLWYQQTIGRGTRTLEGVIDGLNTKEERLEAIAKSAKTHVTVVDFVANCGRHKLVSSIDILGGKISEQVVERAIKIAQELGEEVTVDRLILETEEQLQREEENRKAEAERKRIESEKRRHILATAHYRTIEVSPFENLGMKAVRSRGWDIGRQLSDNQKNTLTNNGVKVDGLTYGQVYKIIGEIKRRHQEGKASYRQVEKLRAMGLSIDIPWQEAVKITRLPACSERQAYRLGQCGYNPMNYDMKSASELITKLKANGWNKLPEAEQTSPPKTNPNAATPGQCARLRRYHYDTSKLTKKEAQRLIFRIVQNKFKPLPLTDPDHPRNWKEPKEVEVEAEPELVVQEDMF